MLGISITFLVSNLQDILEGFQLESSRDFRHETLYFIKVLKVNMRVLQKFVGK